MIVMGVVGLAIIPMIWLAMQQPLSVRHSCNRIRAQAIAEAGIGYAYQKLSTNWDLRSDASAFPLTSYGDGTFDASVTSINSTSVVVSCLGIYQEAQNTVVADMKNYSTNLPTGGQPAATGIFTKAIACGSSLNTGTSNAGTIQGDVVATSITDKKNKITGTETIATVDVKNLINLTPYFNAASNNGAYFPSSQAFHNYSPPGGIAWVDGSISLKGDCVGCFIATSNIFANGGFTQTQVNNYPALISQNGSVGGNNSSAHGLVYAPMGSIDLGGNMTIYGTAICSAPISSFSGGSSIYYQNSTPVPPDIGSTPVNNVGISGWEQ
ncbi:MAG: hypothetical protein NTV49_02290 [Kiritimatiellaeota bacterium]|nr:hypothetical protein [Kiritimatiellota bacterium]